MNGKAKKFLLIAGVLGALFLAYGHFETYWLKIDEIAISNPRISAEFIGKKIVFATDFHCGFFFNGKRLAGIVEKINRLNPDIIILGGDYADYDKNYVAPAFGQLAKLKAKIGVWAVMGNRDYKTDPAAIKSAMAAAGIKLLDNSAGWIESGGQKIKLGGVDDFLQGRADYRPVVGGAAVDDFVIMATHNPTYIDRIDNSKIDLGLSGHTHGGQMTFFGFWVPFFDLKYGHKYQSGIYHKNNTTILVSNGIGTRLLPLRFFARPEINVIMLNN